MQTQITTDLACPAQLSDAGRAGHATILAVLAKNDRMDTGGCKTFYSPVEWRERGEEYGLSAELIVVHDGGDVAALFNYDYDAINLQNEILLALSDAGLFAEPCTCWYTAIYKADID